MVARRHRRHLPAAASIKKRHSLNNQQTQRRQRLLPLATSAACDQCLLPARAAPKCRGRQRAIGCRLGSAAGASALEVPRAPARDRLSPWKCRGRLRPIGGRLGSAAGACARSAVALELPARDASRRVSACVRLAVALEVPRAQAPDRLTRQRLSPIGCRHNNALSPATMGRLRPWVARDHGHQRPSPPACCAAKGCRGQKPRDGPAPQPPRLSCHLG